MCQIKRFPLLALILIGLLSILSGKAATAPSYNIDFGSYNAAPSTAFGAAANQPGVWNQIISGSAVSLTNLTGAATSAQITVTAGDFSGQYGDIKTGDLGLLLNDNFYSAPGSPWSVSITGLANGNYDFYYYAPPHPSVDTGAFTVNGRTATNLIGSDIGNGNDQGVDWQVLHNVAVTNGTMTTGWLSGGSQYTGLSGLQIVRLYPSYNIDFGSHDAAPSTAFGAAANQPGIWNQIISGSPAFLTNLTGTATGAQITVTAQTFTGFSGSGKTGDLGLLLNDNFYSSPGNPWSLSITGLVNGNYDFYYYAPNNSLVDTGVFTVNGRAATNITGSDIGSGDDQGVDWQVLHNVVVTNGTMTTSWLSGGSQFTGLSGMQIVWLNPSYNIDFGSHDAAPATAFGAAANLPGVWNQVISGAPVSLTDLTGAATSAQITVTAGDLGGYWNGGNKTGDLGLLLNDNFYSAPGNPWSLSITGLANGSYDFYYYAPPHPSVDTGAFAVNGRTATNLTGSDISNGNDQGVDWQVLHNVAVTNGTMTTGWLSGGSQYTGLSGIQIVSLNPAPPPNIVVARSGTNLNLSWPSDNIGWRLLEQTNHFATGISLNINDWGVVSGSDNTNLISVPIDPTKPAKFYRLIYP